MSAVINFHAPATKYKKYLYSRDFAQIELLRENKRKFILSKIWQIQVVHALLICKLKILIIFESNTHIQHKVFK